MLNFIISYGLASVAMGALPQQYQEDVWAVHEDAAAIGAMVTTLGVASTAAGIAFMQRDELPSDLLLVTGTAAIGTGVTVMSVAALSARVYPLGRRTTATGGTLAIGMVAMSAVAMGRYAIGSRHDRVLWNDRQGLAVRAGTDKYLLASAGLSLAAIVPVTAQLLANGAAWRNRERHITWTPMVFHGYTGSTFSVRF